MSHKPFLKAKGYQQPVKQHGYVPSLQVQFNRALLERAEQRVIARCDYWWQYDHNVYPREAMLSIVKPITDSARLIEAASRIGRAA